MDGASPSDALPLKRVDQPGQRCSNLRMVDRKERTRVPDRLATIHSLSMSSNNLVVVFQLRTVMRLYTGIDARRLR